MPKNRLDELILLDLMLPENSSTQGLVDSFNFLNQFYVIAKTLDSCVNWGLWPWQANRCIFQCDACWLNLPRL